MAWMAVLVTSTVLVEVHTLTNTKIGSDGVGYIPSVVSKLFVEANHLEMLVVITKLSRRFGGR